MSQAAYDVMVVDDEPVVLNATAKILDAEGLALDVAQSAEAAMKKIEVNRYRLYATLENALNGFKRGVFDFIPKPFDVGELLGVVRRGLDFAERAGDGPPPVGLDAWLRQAPTSDGIPGKAYALGGHAWVVLESEGRARVGMGETFASIGGQFRDVRLPPIGEDLIQGNQCLRIETSDQLVHRLWTPLSGQVIETNTGAFADTNGGGFGAVCKRWVVTLIPGNLSVELPNLTLR
jgi:CheY-like chemotaxis protein